MNKKHLATLAMGTVLAANSLLADWTDYFWIGNPGPGGFAQLTPGNSQILTPGNPNPGTPGAATPWTFGVTGAGTGGELTRSPGNNGAEATGFTLTVLGGGNTTSALTILNPQGPPSGPSDSGSYWCSAYNFSWNFDAKAGSTAYWIDADGMHPITPIIGTGVFKVVEAGFDGNGDPNPRDTYGFYMNGDLLNTLQIQGWECVPEPSSIAMGAVTLLGAALVGYRRLRK